ncbi:uncharacterized protein EI97DRAFT_460864 [Westerdykella ornata]|uniref:Uncharacterized protein n=1 Tax=Westerdykella ornata TaxID=318751 RepID=A0A6A6JBK7_WESOR|nr:uncharacterized protein EI97DRAFT_460864 [Westerdykella ornata]KAF2273675.1 hypothetical protein EI97DRAFT_460864 [Westerdykella ornata]
MNVEASLQLKHTNVSRPRLSHSTSQQSIAASQAASEGYYSLHSASEVSSGDSDGRSCKPTPGRTYHTPPSQYRTPAQSHEHIHQQQSDAPVTSLKGVGIPRQHPVAGTQSPAVSTIAEERPETQERRSLLRPEMDSESLATTPGMDETPYIRFAIDQITRDEEVRGSRRYPLDPPAEEDDYPVERIVSDDGLGYLEQEQEREQRMSRPPQLPSPPPLAGPVSDPMYDLPPKKATGKTPQAVPIEKDVFTATSLPNSPLHFLPNVLRPFWLGMLILLCLIMSAALIYSAIYSNRNSGAGLWDYNRFGDIRYFVFQYLPTIVGMIILLWLFQVQIALQRIVPFVSMASGSAKQHSEAVFLELYPTQFLFPKFEHFKAGQPLVGSFYLVSWLFIWTIPLLASSFNVRYSTEEGVWKWVAVQGIIWAVVALYILLTISLLSLLVFLLRKETGLKWDPRSLADIIALLERSNTMSDYDGSETFSSKEEFKQRLGHRTDRIGYWSTTKRPNDIFHGIGEEGAPSRRYSLEDGRIREKAPGRLDDLNSAQRPSDFSIRMDLRSPRTRLRYLKWYLRDTFVVAWIVAAFVLFIAFLVVSYVNSAIRLGFLPQVAARTDASGFSVSDFLYSFIPSLIAHLLFLSLLSLDYSVRTLQPYISLSQPGGSTAESSLLLDYAARLPLSATFSALENHHYQSAILSTSSLCSSALPILAGGAFWTQYYVSASVVRVSADLPAYYALCVFLALYTFSLLALLPNRRRAALPHRSSSLAEIISWVYQSPILTDRAFARPKTKPELVARLMGSAWVERTWGQSLTNLVRPSRSNLRAEELPVEKEKEKLEKRKLDGPTPKKHNSVVDPGKIRYGFGIYVGRDGLEHLGIDRVARGGERSGRELVIYEEQRRASGRRSGKGRVEREFDA